MVKGIGIDVVEIDRMQRIVDRWGDRFLTKVFTEKEIRYADVRQNPIHHICGRFAVKEAVAKALTTGWSRGFRWKDVEVTNNPAGQPLVILSGIARELLKDCRVHVTISHAESVVVAAAVIDTP